MKRPNSTGWWAAGRAVLTLLVLSLLSNCEDPIELKAPEPPMDSPEALVTVLAKAYLQRDPELFRSLLANAPDRPQEGDQSATYLFILSEPTNTGETQWRYTDEVRIEKRMFHPESPDPGDQQVDSALWLRSLQISLTPLESFGERRDLYSVNHGVDGKLDPDIWKASDARYTTYVLFDLAGELDYKVEGEANFVVIEDKTKVVGQTGKFLIYVWEDLGSGVPTISQSATWSGVKGLYR